MKRQQETEKLIRQSTVKLVTSGKKICACVKVCECVKKGFEEKNKQQNSFHWSCTHPSCPVHYIVLISSQPSNLAHISKRGCRLAAEILQL